MTDSHPDISQDPNGENWDVMFYLSSADKAASSNRKKLAIHLYISAFELELADKEAPSEAVIDGMHKAWNIACDISDRSSAETLFTELAPFSDPEQVQTRVHQLQEMAITQLKEMGVPGDRIEKMSIIHTPDATAAGADPNFVNKFFNMMKTNVSNPAQANQPVAPRDLDSETSQDDAEDDMEDDAMGLPRWGNPHEDEAYATKTYDDIVGYEAALKSMGAYGFDVSGDPEFREFLQSTSEFHGLDELSLYDPFYFYGPSRDDVYEFAEATAGEIGNPVLTLHVRKDDEGMWTIRLSGPFRRGLFGVSDPTDIPTPATFIIENIDILQEFMTVAGQNEMQAMDDMPGSGPQMYGEIMGYIHAIMHKPDIFPIITASEKVKLAPPFDELFDRAKAIEVPCPDFEERKRVWSHFALGHTSFSEIDIDELSRLSEGISRRDMITAGQNAVRDAYQESLAKSEYRFVTINDVLFEMVPFASPDESSYSAMEDAAAEAFSNELDDFTFEDEDKGAQDKPDDGE